MVKQLHNRPDPASGRTDDGAFERLFELSVRLAEAMDRGLGERGLTRARAELIWLLRGRSPLTQRQLSQELRCTPRNVTGLVDGLEQMGLVRREPHATDRRATLVTLTPTGGRVAASMAADYGRAASELFADLSAAELRLFSSALKKILARLRTGEAAPTPRSARKVARR